MSSMEADLVSMGVSYFLSSCVKRNPIAGRFSIASSGWKVAQANFNPSGIFWSGISFGQTEGGRGLALMEFR